MSSKKRSKLDCTASPTLTLVSRIISIVLSITVIYPIVFIVLVSFKNNQEFYNNIWGLPEIWRFSNYYDAWIGANLSVYIYNSVIVSFTSVLGSAFVAAIAGYALSKMNIPKAELLLSILLMFNFVPGVAIYISLYRQLISMSLGGTLWMLILPYLAGHIPFSVYIYKKFFDSLPMELLEAARIDGSGELNTFFKVVLPLVYPATASVMVFSFIGTWGEYMWANIASVSSVSIQTLPVGLLYFRGEYGIEWGPFSAAIIIIIVPLMLIFIYLQKYFIQGLTAGAVKG